MSEMVDRLVKLGLTRGQARVAILELAKPTDEMVLCGLRTLTSPHVGGYSVVTRNMWQAMLNEALGGDNGRRV